MLIVLASDTKRILAGTFYKSGIGFDWELERYCNFRSRCDELPGEDKQTNAPILDRMCDLEEIIFIGN